MSKPVALTIAGSDPTGGAGIQADLKTFAAHNVYGASAITVLTAQNAHRFETFPTPPSFITAQIEAVFEELSVQAIKIGMLANQQMVATVIEALKRHNGARHIPVVLDPVIKASNGGVALDPAGLRLLRDELLPLTTLIKPNILEAALLLEEAEATTVEQMKQQAVSLGQASHCAVLLSGGHLAGPDAVDILVIEGQISVFSVKKLEIPDLHGTGCTLTSSITANLAKGFSLHEAVELSKAWMARLLGENPILDRTGVPRSIDHMAVMAGSSLKK
jgi:hydroxymethylpyrimidine/phosphomethylpyrimidine kinase